MSNQITVEIIEELTPQQTRVLAKANKIRFVGLPTDVVKEAIVKRITDEEELVIPEELEELLTVEEPVEEPVEELLTKEELLHLAGEMEQVSWEFDKRPESLSAEGLQEMILEEAESMGPRDFKWRGAVEADLSKDMDWVADQEAVVFSQKAVDLLCRLKVSSALEFRASSSKKPAQNGGKRTSGGKRVSLRTLLFDMIKEGVYTRNELISMLKAQAPGKSDSSYATAISDCKSAKYCGWDQPALVDEFGKFHFENC